MELHDSALIVKDWRGYIIYLEAQKEFKGL